MEDSTDTGADTGAGEVKDAPWHLWAVGVLGLLFAAFGAYDYIMSQIGDRDYVAAAVEPMGIDVDAAIEYFANFPLWIDFFWAVGVWSAVAGAILLLLRRRLAYPAYAASLVGLAITNGYSFVNPIPGVEHNAMSAVVVGIVVLVMVLLTIYARRQATTGVLR